MSDWGVEFICHELRITYEELGEALAHEDHYRRKEIPKKSGGVRVTFAPHPKLGKVQELLLHRFLYGIEVDPRLHAFIPGRSPVTNAIFHASAMPKCVLRLDFKDAFPSVKAEHIRSVLREVIKKQQKNRFEGIDMLSGTLRKRQNEQLKLFEPNEPLPSEKMLEQALDIILALTTHRGRLPQGASTSPYLLNIVITYSGLLERIEKVLLEHGVVSDYKMEEKRFPWKDSLPPIEKTPRPAFTFYSDDLTVSSSRSIAWRTILALIQTIEEHGIFRVNRKKILYFNGRQAAPLITGVRIALNTRTESALENFLREKCGMLSEESAEYAAELAKPFGGQWLTPRVLLSKKYRRKVRGILHRAVRDEALRKSAFGHVAHIKSVYRTNIPSQIVVPYDRLTESMMIEFEG